MRAHFPTAADPVEVGTESLFTHFPLSDKIALRGDEKNNLGQVFSQDEVSQHT
jgi:hypothetical protein